MRTFTGHIAEEKGKEFEQKVCIQFKSLKWEAKTNVPMKQLGAGKEYGDIDVLAWSPGSDDVLAIECKRLKPAKTIGEIGEQLREFRGINRDKLDKHLERVKWLRDNNNMLRKFVCKARNEIKIHPLLITNYPVPIKFRDNLPMKKELIMQLDDISYFLDSKINKLTAD
jgi:hypothetical protein